MPRHGMLIYGLDKSDQSSRSVFGCSVSAFISTDLRKLIVGVEKRILRLVLTTRPRARHITSSRLQSWKSPEAEGVGIDGKVSLCKTRSFERDGKFYICAIIYLHILNINIGFRKFPLCFLCTLYYG